MGVALCVILLGVGNIAGAQEYNPNCGPAPDDELAVYQRRACASFLPCKFVQDIGNTGCRLANGLSTLFTTKAREEESGYDALPETEKLGVWQRIKLSVSDVFEAASPPLTPEATLAIERGLSKVTAEAAAKSPGAYSGMLDPNKAGRAGYYEGQLTNGKPDGAGTVIGSDGRMVRGEFQGGALKRGEVVRQDGVIMAGRWENGAMNGRGAVQLADGVVETSNTYKDGTPIGPLTRTYPDGSREIQVRDAEGKVVATGARAPKGQEPQAPTYTPPMAGGPSGRGIIVEQFDRCIGTPNNNFCKDAKLAAKPASTPTSAKAPLAPGSPLGGVFAGTSVNGNIAANSKASAAPAPAPAQRPQPTPTGGAVARYRAACPAELRTAMDPSNRQYGSWEYVTDGKSVDQYIGVLSAHTDVTDMTRKLKNSLSIIIDQGAIWFRPLESCFITFRLRELGVDADSVRRQVCDNTAHRYASLNTNVAANAEWRRYCAAGGR